MVLFIFVKPVKSILYSKGMDGFLILMLIYKLYRFVSSSIKQESCNDYFNILSYSQFFVWYLKLKYPSLLLVHKKFEPFEREIIIILKGLATLAMVKGVLIIPPSTFEFKIRDLANNFSEIDPNVPPSIFVENPDDSFYEFGQDPNHFSYGVRKGIIEDYLYHMNQRNSDMQNILNFYKNKDFSELAFKEFIEDVDRHDGFLIDYYFRTGDLVFILDIFRIRQAQGFAPIPDKFIQLVVDNLKIYQKFSKSNPDRVNIFDFEDEE
jgi:hypothetical protein